MIEKGKTRIRKTTEKAFEGGIEKQLDEDATRRWLMERLESERQAMFKKLMGFETSFGELRPNHDGLFTKVLQPMMREQLGKIIEEHFPQLVEKVWEQEKEKLTDAFKKELRRSFENKLRYEMESRARKLGEEMAVQVVLEMRQEMKL
jgi:hypothetical protein